jgi:hypothetical protein
MKVSVDDTKKVSIEHGVEQSPPGFSETPMKLFCANSYRTLFDCFQLEPKEQKRTTTKAN